MGDLKFTSGGTREVDLLVYSGKKVSGIVANMAAVNFVSLGNHAAETDQLFARRAGARGVHQAG